MYPNHYFSLYPAYPRSYRVFVAMSFDQRLQARWENVISPAIADVRVGGVPLVAHRVDLSRKGDAILTEILHGISEATLVVADITSLSQLDNKAVRNANVMYEVGIAHAVRLPDEVIVLRSDDHPLDFDVRGVRVHAHKPDHEPAAARAFLTELVVENLNGLDARQQLSVRAALGRLTTRAVEVLLDSFTTDVVAYPATYTLPTTGIFLMQVEAIHSLIALGALEAELMTFTPDHVNVDTRQIEMRGQQYATYRVTAFGRALRAAVTEKLGLTHPDIRARLTAATNPAPPSTDVQVPEESAPTS